MTIKELFDKGENGTLTYEQFEAFSKEGNLKFADLSTGEYVSKSKFDNEIASKESQITQLNDTIKSRDKDLKDLKAQLTEAGADSDKLTELQNQFNTLQSKYDNDAKEYKAQLNQQAYEFAVKEFAGTKKFTSNAAKRDFISSMIAKGLKMDGDKILGADDYVTAYTTDNADAFVVEKQEETTKPTFVQSTTSNPQNTDNANPFNFSFQGVRPKPKND